MIPIKIYYLFKTMSNSFSAKGSFKIGAWFTRSRRLEPVHQRELWMASSLGTKPWPRMSDCQVLRQLVYGIGEKNFHQHGTKIFLKKKTWNKNPILVKVNRP